MRLRGIYPGDLYKAWNADKIGPAYYFAGEDLFEKDRARQKLLKLLDPDPSCVHRLCGAEVEGGQLVALAESLALFGGHRVIWVEDAHKIPVAAKRPLADYLASPNPATCLIFSTEEWKVDPADPVAAGILALGGLVHFQPPRGERLAQWLARTAQEAGLILAPEAAERLIAQAGESPQILHQEIQRLALYKRGCGPGARSAVKAEEEDVLACLGYSVSPDLRLLEKTLSRAIVDRSQQSRRQALLLVERLLAEEEPVRVYNWVCYAVQHLLAGKRLLAEGVAPEDLRRATGAWHNDEIAFHAARAREKELLAALKACLRTEIALKTGSPQPDLDVKDLVLRITA